MLLIFWWTESHQSPINTKSTVWQIQSSQWTCYWFSVRASRSMVPKNTCCEVLGSISCTHYWRPRSEVTVRCSPLWLSALVSYCTYGLLFGMGQRVSQCVPTTGATDVSHRAWLLHESCKHVTHLAIYPVLGFAFLNFVYFAFWDKISLCRPGALELSK